MDKKELQKAVKQLTVENALQWQYMWRFFKESEGKEFAVSMNEDTITITCSADVSKSIILCR